MANEGPDPREFSKRFPSADELAKFETASPGFANRIFDAMESDREVEAQMFQEFIRIWGRAEILSTIAILFVYILLVGFATLALYWDHTQVAVVVVGIAFGSTTVSAAVKAAIRRWSRPDVEERHQST